MSYSDAIDTAIFTLLVVWCALDRSNVYFRKEKEPSRVCPACGQLDLGHRCPPH